jgi:choline dehydrogenase-like flavoprotein
MSDTLTAAQRTTLKVLCDTIVPSVERPDDPSGFWKRKATDIGIDQYVEGYLATLPADQRAGLAMLLDGLALQDFVTMPSNESREQVLLNTSLSSGQAAAGIGALRSLILLLYYGVVDPVTGRNPNWTQYGYPGPVGPPPAVAKQLPVRTPDGERTIEADAVIVGSGSGGSVIAAQLAGAGLSVVVLEGGGYYNESDFAQSELKAYNEMYWRAGPTASADGNVTLMAGATLGGGTVVNWTNCVRTPDWVRREWAEHGLHGVDGPEFDAHLDAVLERIGAVATCSDLNPAQAKVVAGCDRLGWKHKRTQRNTDPATYKPETAGYIGFGDQSGSKRSADKTWLADAVAHGAKLYIHTRARRILVENGRAAGVEATHVDAEGKLVTLTVRAPRVVVAGGALESPSLLLRSGIGGPAVGSYLRLHPCAAVLSVHAEDMQAWWGAPHAMICDEFASPPSTYGFLIEGSHYSTALGAAATPWTGGRAHKELLADTRRGVTTIGLLRDRGHGRVTIDQNGESVVTYAMTDPIDIANFHLAMQTQIRLGEATGASAMYLIAPSLPRWRYGDDVDAFIDKAKRLPIGLGGVQPFSAHQMGTCRMGSDPATSVADPSGELHDVRGVWIGDGSAFPTPSGANPMVSIMALARRTAAAMLADRSAAGSAQAGGPFEIGACPPIAPLAALAARLHSES